MNNLLKICDSEIKALKKHYLEEIYGIDDLNNLIFEFVGTYWLISRLYYEKYLLYNSRFLRNNVSINKMHNIQIAKNNIIDCRKNYSIFHFNENDVKHEITCNICNERIIISEDVNLIINAINYHCKTNQHYKKFVNKILKKKITLKYNNV